MRHIKQSQLPNFLVLLALVAALPAAAQIVAPNTLVVVDTTETWGDGVEEYWTDYLSDSADAYISVQSAVTDALTFSRASGEPYIILVVAKNNSAPWTGSVILPADANVQILGEPRLDDTIAAIATHVPVIDGNGFSAIKITNDTSEAEYADDTANLNSLCVEGLKLIDSTGTADVSGIHLASVDATPPTYSVVFNRIWIDSFTQHGVLIDGNNATANLVNCSISDNGEDGVHVNVTPDDPDKVTDILHCTIVGNASHGVYVTVTAAPGEKPPKYAQVRNSIIYDNGDSTPQFEGGLVWSDSITIVPDEDVYTGGATVNIYGDNLLDGIGGATVFFGPRDLDGPNPGVLFVANADNDGIVGAVPASYNSAPGIVDVHIVRDIDTDLERTYTLQRAFTYTEVNSGPVYVTLVTPSHGPPEGGNKVMVKGVRFHEDSQVWFDFNHNREIDAGSTLDSGLNGTPDIPGGSFTPYGPVPVWTPNEFEDQYFDNNGGRWLIVSNTVDTVFLEGNTGALFDTDWSILRPSDLLAADAMGLASALLHTTVPAAPGWYNAATHNTSPMDVLVRNRYQNGGWSDSHPGDDGFTEYAYDYEDRLEITANSQPLVVQISPNFYRRVNNDSIASTFKADILGWNFAPGAAVRIGGVMCPYTMISNIATGLTLGDWTRIIDVEIPIAEFGAGGSFDVEVTNPSGHFDVLLNAFTYYADSTPETGQMRNIAFEWYPSNFVDYHSVTFNTPVGNVVPRRLYGDGFDTGLRIGFNDVNSVRYTIDDPFTNTDLNADSIVLPHERVDQHNAHTQRFIDFLLPIKHDVPSVINAFEDEFTSSAVFSNTPGLCVTVERGEQYLCVYAVDVPDLACQIQLVFVWFINTLAGFV